MIDKIRIATRGSSLALAQAYMVRDLLKLVHPALAVEGKIEIRTMQTTGDKLQLGSLASVGGKGLFTKEIEVALIENTADIAVHSMKDLPTILPGGLVLKALLPREDPRDALVTRDNMIQSLTDLPAGAIVGTASLRRKAILLSLRPDVKINILRGAVPTRLSKVQTGEFDATFLAVAGLKRLGLLSRAAAILEPEEMLPAVCQGTIGIECRENDEKMCDLLTKINHKETEICTYAERAFLALLDGSCQTPIGGLGQIKGPIFSFRGLIVRPDGSEVHTAQRGGKIDDAVEIGLAVGEDLKTCAGPGFFDDVS